MPETYNRPPQLTQIDAAIKAAIAQRIFPGAVVLVSRAGQPIHTAAYGTTMYTDAGTRSVTLSTCYDIASLTKVFTATAALQLYDRGLLDLDSPVAAYLPNFRARTVTVRHLLTHTSGLQVQMSKLRTLTPTELRAAIYALEPAMPPGTTTAYVNVNTFLLGDLIAAVCKQPLDILFEELLRTPLGLTDTTFNPPPEQHERIPPTEYDPDWRGRLIHGTAHDESTHALGGVAGHAGLFSTAADLQQFLQMWLSTGRSNGQQLLQATTTDLATRYQGPWLQLDEQSATIRCGLGWMLDRTAILGPAPSGSYGHTGFTGPVLAVIPQHQLTIVLLCNRTYPRRPASGNHFPTVRAVVAAALAAHDRTSI